MEKVAEKIVRTETDWAALVEEHKRLGCSVAVFCRGQGIAYSLFLYHRRKILKMRQGVQSIARSVVGMSIPRTGDFIPVRINESCGLRFRFPAGLILESEGIPPASWVVEVALGWAGAKDVPC